MGPALKALSASLAKPSLRGQLEKCFDESPFDASAAPSSFPRSSLATMENTGGSSSQSALGLQVPKTDIFSELPSDIIAKLVSSHCGVRPTFSYDESNFSNSVFVLQQSKEGKTSWKLRKEALDEIDAAIRSSSGLLETGPSQMKQLVDLTRALRDRLSDTQINLKPLAARIVGALLSAVDKACQAKLGRLVYTQLINAAMNDIKKPMRDASLETLRAGITTSSLDVGGLNELALEGLVSALVVEVNDSSVRVSVTTVAFMVLEIHL